jgi:hypothetical protein
MANPVISVAANYLSDISGGENPVSLDALVKETGLAALTPETVQTYINDLDKAQNDGVHSYLCNIDKAEKTGQANQCKTGSDLSANDKRLARDNQGYGYIEVIHPIGNREFYYFGLATDPNFDLPPWRGKSGTSAPLRRFKGNQSNPNNASKNQTFKTKRVVNDRTKAAKKNRENFRKAVEGGDDKSIGHRAILFDDKGNVIKGANAIRDRNIATELSSSIPKDAGLIPADSPYMQESKAIDTFVAAREKDNPELKENIDKLTQEIKTQDEIKKELKDEAEAKAKVKAKTDKDNNDLLKLVDATKTNVDKVREKDI